MKGYFMITKVKGTQDFIDLQLFDFIVDQTKKHCAEYNFAPVVTPIIERIDLFQRSLGTESDAVSKELFVVKSRDGDEDICLRPESTASTVRAFVENGIQTTPWKVYNWGPMFRYDRPQKGRYRQFHQFSFEIIGSDSVTQDVLLISMLHDLFFHKFKIDEYTILINFLGTKEDRYNYIQALKTYLDSVSDGICKDCKIRKERNTLRVIDCKNAACQLLYQNAPQITDFLSESSQQEWKQLREQLDVLSIPYKITPTLVRGLDYYCKTVFEFTSPNLGAQSAFGGGGRYNELVQAVGGKEDQPSVGAGIGIERLMMMLEPIKDTLVINQQKPLTLIIPCTTEQQTLALLISQQLHTHNITNDILFDGSIKSMMRKANKMGATYVVLIGPEEQQSNTVTVKNMTRGKEEKIAQALLADFLKQ
jgi:histidyl-tRNA synthetase